MFHGVLNTVVVVDAVEIDVMRFGSSLKIIVKICLNSVSAVSIIITIVDVLSWIQFSP